MSSKRRLFSCLLWEQGFENLSLRENQTLSLSKCPGLKHLIINMITPLLLFLFISCGNWGWESIDTDNEQYLNVFGLISLDDSLKSFIVVHKTLGTEGSDYEIIGHDTIYYEVWQNYNEDSGLFEADTFWYNPPIIITSRESKYVVKDATVIISDDTQDYVFERSPSGNSPSEEYYGSIDIFSDPAIYFNTDQSFSPQPNTNYDLHIATPDGLELSGSVTTPPIPEINESALDDTLSIKNLFQISWIDNGEYTATVTTGSIGTYWESRICGMDQSGVVQVGDTTWNSTFQSWCYEYISEPTTESASLDIRLRYLDENYYKYFLASDEGGEFISNIFVGPGGIGSAFGVEGGYGVFGAIAADWTKRIAVP